MTKAKQRSKVAPTRPASPSGNQRGKTMQTQPTTSNKPKNGQKADDTARTEPVTNTADTSTTADGETPAARPAWRARGIMPTMPMVVYYKQDGKVHAAVHHPVDKSSLIESGRGIGSAKGGLEDMGFLFSPTSATGPEWLTALVPVQAEIIGYASIKGFPLPKQQ